MVILKSFVEDRSNVRYANFIMTNSHKQWQNLTNTNNNKNLTNKNSQSQALIHPDNLFFIGQILNSPEGYNHSINSRVVFGYYKFY